MEHKARPGIVLLNICGTPLLTATRQAWKDVPRVRPIPRMWSGCWSLMSNGRTIEEAIAAFARLLRLSEQTVQEQILPMVETLSREGYLVPVEEDPA